MNARDELGKELWKHHYEEYTMNPDGTERAYCQCGDSTYPTKSLVQHQAEVALEATKPRTIETVEELDTLPAESVVRCAAEMVYEKYPDDDGAEFDFWLLVGDSKAMPSSRITLPATVLYEPRQS